MRRRTFLVAVPTTLALALVPVALGVGGGSAHAAGADLGALNTIQKRLLSGRASFELADAHRASPTSLSAQERPAARYFPMSPGEKVCEDSLGGDVKVNVNCLNLTDPDLAGRGQAQNETSIAADPRQPNRLLGSSNDYRRGDGSCYTYYSSTSGRAWQDSTPPDSSPGARSTGSSTSAPRGSTGRAAGTRRSRSTRRATAT